MDLLVPEELPPQGMILVFPDTTFRAFVDD